MFWKFSPINRLPSDGKQQFPSEQFVAVTHKLKIEENNHSSSPSHEG